MGRVARYKKVKACDPFAKGNRRVTIGGETVWGLGDDGRKAKKRSRTAEKLRTQRKKKSKLDHHVDRAFDAPPDEGDEFDINDMLGSLKKKSTAILENEIIRVSVPVTKSSPTVSTPADATKLLKEDASATRLLKLEKQVLPKKDTNEHQGRMEGESKNAYKKRMANETRQIIKRENIQAHNPEKRQRKKEFLNSKKKAKKGKGGSGSQRFDEDDDMDPLDDDAAESALVTGEQAYAKRAAATQVQFGEQAERPPTFKQLPRTAKVKTGAKVQDASRLGLDEAAIEAEQREMEAMRRKVRAQYALIRAKRHHAGDFHL